MKQIPYEKRSALYDVAETFEWSKWDQEIPFIKWPSEWEVKARPPFHTGIIRYIIRDAAYPSATVSVYLDCYDQAGCMGYPYWETHPYHGDCFRCKMHETDKLLEAIAEGLKEQIYPPTAQRGGV